MAVSTVRRLWLWLGFLVLVAIGVTIAVVRAWAILADWSAFDAMTAILPPQLRAEGLVLERWYAAHGSLTLGHVLLGAAFLAIVPLQVAESPRRRWPMLHRWVGRGLVMLGLPVAASGLALGGLSPFGGRTADAAIFLFAALFLLALGRGFQAARRRESGQRSGWG